MCGVILSAADGKIEHVQGHFGEIVKYRRLMLGGGKQNLL